MFNREKKTLLALAVLVLLLSPNILYAEEAPALSVNSEVLPISVTEAGQQAVSADEDKSSNTLVSPSKPSTTEDIASGEKDLAKEEVAMSANNEASTSSEASNAVAEPAPVNDNFDFDLKLETVSIPVAPIAPEANGSVADNNQVLTDADLPKTVQYKTNPIDNLSNSVLSQMDDDLFSQMSEIEKSTTLLTLELRREKIRNEIEAQKAIRQKAFDDLERQKEEAKLKDLERKKQIEAKVLKEKQELLSRQQILEVLKQRKLLNAYMNHMLVTQQAWLREKESLYGRISAMEQEKKDLTDLFKQKVEKLLEASAQNIQAAEAARVNFDRVVKSLKARNEQLRKRIEADAKIIKNAQSSLHLKSQSLEELQSRNSSLESDAVQATGSLPKDGKESLDKDDDAELLAKLSSQYAILGISGRADNMFIEVIDVNGQPITVKIGSALPSGHVLREIGTDYAMFARDGMTEYLYVGRTIDGYVPTLGLVTKDD